MRRDREWMQGFLHLDALQEDEHISDEAIALQEDTVLCALDILEREPGVLLADEVGMGKTFQALGLLACQFQMAAADGRTPKVLVVTPGASLNLQWLRSAQTFAEKGFYASFSKATFTEVKHITELHAAMASHAVVFAPVNVFTSARGYAERGFLLNLWFRRRELAGPTRAAIRSRIAQAGIPIEDGDRFLGLPPEAFDDVPESAYRRREPGGHAGLDDLHDAGLDAFTSGWAVKKALDRVRFHLVREKLPELDYLVVDEAHKLKNAQTVQAQAVAQVLGGLFHRAVFLTATPFQLSVEELKRVFEMFGRAKQVRPGFKEDVEALFAAIADYQRTYDAFEDAWRFAEVPHAKGFADWYALAAKEEVAAAPRAPVPHLDALEDPNVVRLARQAWELRRLKEHGVENGFRRWTIRSLKPGKKERRKHEAPPIKADDASLMPLLLYQRLMTARARSGVHTHVEAAETNIASSFSAARVGAMAQDSGASAEASEYRAVVHQLLVDAEASHPKVRHVLDQLLAAADAWEKSLVFCERNATIAGLHAAIQARWVERLVSRWERFFPGADEEEIFGAGSGADRVRGRFQVFAAQFTGGKALSIALRESHAHTLFVAPEESDLPPGLWRDEDWLIAEANDVLGHQRASGSSTYVIDWRLAQRCVDVAVARWFERHRPAVLDRLEGLPRRLLLPEYPRIGIDLHENLEELEMVGDADAPITWSISPDTFRAILSPSRPSIWFPFRKEMADWDPRERSDIVDAVRTYLTRRHVPFILDVIERSGGDGLSPAGFRTALEAWWQDPVCPWRRRLGEFLDYMKKLGKDERAEIRDNALPVGDFAARGNDTERRQKLQDAFNTPFFPMILIGNRTMQEGLNLQRQCRRITHHDLRWNPADVEQRVGRIDRHGSMAERLLAETCGERGHILIDTPLLERTIDPPRYRRVKEREKWLEFLLGRPPEVSDSGLEGRVVAPLPAKFAEDLRVRLGPSRTVVTAEEIGPEALRQAT